MSAQPPPLIALLHVDADLDASAMLVTERGLTRLAPRELVVFGESPNPRSPGARKAVDEICGICGWPLTCRESGRHGGLRVPLFGLSSVSAAGKGES